MNRARFLSLNWWPRFALFIFLCALAFALTPRTGAHSELRIDESRTVLSLIREPAELLLPLDNQTGSPLDAKLQLAFLNTDDRVLTTVEKAETIPSGTSVLKTTIPLGLSTLTSTGKANLVWMRLSYRITANGTTLAQGTLPFSEIAAADLFELRVVNSLMVKEGGTYRVRVQTIHPLTHKPVRNVHIATKVTLEDDEEDIVLERFANTDADGFATLDFKLPPKFPEFPHTTDPVGGELEVVASRGVVVRELTTDVLVDQFARTVLTTDKPIYQPAQVVHARALIFGPSRRVLPNQEVTFFVKDPEDQVVFQSKATTSRFGVANADWTIADNSRLGDYRLGVRFEEQDDGEWLDLKYLRVSRYELPNFAVKVTPDRKYYLPGQNAEVTISGDYLFGQKVTKGHVKVVRETSREWNYREQKWVIDEGDTYEGETDNDGVFVARVDLSEHHDEIKDQSYRRFADIEYAAYFTDPTTNRTEQRRFALRVTKERIHVYLQKLGTYHYNPRLPGALYVSASYADGVPAQCKVDLAFRSEDDSRVVRTQVQTNQYGLAKVPRLHLPLSWESEIEIKLTARDSLNRTGTDTDSIYIDDDSSLIVTTDKVLYRVGQPIVVTVNTDLKDSWVFVDIGTDSNLIQTERLTLKDGRGVLRIPYRKEFQERLWITSYPAYPERRGNISSRSVLFPEPRNLKIQVQPTQATYRPGDSARVNFNVSVGSNLTAESALGVVVFDRAVEERNRTDQESGREYVNSLRRLLGEDEELAGVTYNQLRNIDMSKPVAANLELLAEMLLNQGTAEPSFHDDDDFEADPAEVFNKNINDSLQPLKDALTRQYAQSQEYPRDTSSLRRILETQGVDLSKIRDPWSRDFTYEFSTEEASDSLLIRSAGADKKPATDDDFLVWKAGWYYFTPVKEAIERAVYEYHRRTGGFIRDFDALKTEVQKSGISLETLRDRWGQPYRFTFAIKEKELLIVVSSSGPNRRFEQDKRHSDDFELSSTSVDYFSELRASIDRALTHYEHNNHSFPASEKELLAAVKQSDIDFGSLRDAWGQPLYFSFGEAKRYEYGPLVEVHSRFGQPGAEQVAVKPATPPNKVIRIRSAGPDQSSGTPDDFDLAAYDNSTATEPTDEETNVPITLPIVFMGSGGMIIGTVLAPSGALVSGAKVVLDSDRSTETDANGRFQFGNVPSGKHVIAVEASGFKKAILSDVPASAIEVTTVNVVLEVGTVSETVTVTGDGPIVQQTRSLSALPITGGRNLRLVTKSGSPQDFFTPRLREYFPETLLWQPELTTDKRGRAQLDFKLADNITTWKMSVIGSTENGQLGTAETEIRAFQPFFAELDPPRVLTQGDRISLPVVLRNYLPNTQTVDVELKPESWFSVLDSNQKRIQIPAGEAKTPTFDLRTNNAVVNGKQRVTARATDFSDAIEKTVNVHPDGEQRVVTESELFEKTATVDVDLPEETSPNSQRVELKIYPNLLTHVWESVEGIMQRPYGCGEQTISSSYPSLLVLKHLKEDQQDSTIAKKAKRYVELGYQRLLGYQKENGGFGYWTQSEADLAVTAYAIRFLNDAAEVVSVDREIIESAAGWLVGKQHGDGSWLKISYDGKEDRRQTELLTSLIARSLAVSEIKVANETKAKDFKRAVSRALNYLDQASARTSEPYLIANYALAAKAAGNNDSAKQAAERLRTLSHQTGNGVYWELETSTPFYGWGRAGRLETTALAMQAVEEKDIELRNRGLLFLLREQDRYGLWYSTQATINVLDAMLSMLAQQPKSGADATAELLVNGRVVQRVELPKDQEMVAPVVVDLSTFVNRGHNEVQLRRTNGQIANLQLVSTYYLPWSNQAKAASLRLQTSFDKTNVRVMEEITCRVTAERVDPRGRGMLLAEIGLPPGADVDRASLETAKKSSGWAINHYDVLPEKVVVYLWPRAGGTEFTFKFKPRFAMTAKSEASMVYDYYNPEANAVVSPTTFIVRQQ